MEHLLKNAKLLPIINWNYTFFGAHLQRVPKEWEYPKERHTAFEMIYILSGTERIECDPYSYTLNKGDFAIISPGTFHHVQAISELTYFCFHFDLDEPIFEEQLIANSKIVYHDGESINNKISSDMKDMITLIHGNPEGQYRFEEKMKIQIILSNILLALYQHVSISTKPGNVSNMQFAKIIRVHIKKAMHQGLSQAISNPGLGLDDTKIISTICQQLNLSIGYASRIFKTYYGASPKAYLSDIKQELAQQLLIKPQFNIEQISEILGYNNPGNFSRQFKIWTGDSPKEYRRRKVSHFVDQKLFSKNFSMYMKNNSNNKNRENDFWKK